MKKNEKKKKKEQQGRIHDSISRVRMGRGFDAVWIASPQKLQQRDRRTDGPAGRVAYSDKKHINAIE